MRTHFIFGLYFGLFGLLGILGYYITFNTIDILTYQVVSRDGERVCTANSDNTGMTCKYLEFFENEVFENTDNMFYGKWNSSDVHAKIREGYVCNLTVSGWRVPIFSMYRNILEANCRPIS